MDRRVVVSLAGAGAFLLVAATAWAAGKNLQYYPKDTSQEDLKAQMGVLKASLGVNCAHCHKYEPKRDFPADTDTKKIARSMLFMTDKLNKACFTKQFLGIKDEEVPQVTCFTCHKGKEKPELKPEKPELNKKFEAEAKDQKNQAMVANMKKVVEKLNKDFFTWKDAPKATCWMCHHGEMEINSKAPTPGD